MGCQIQGRGLPGTVGRRADLLSPPHPPGGGGDRPDRRAAGGFRPLPRRRPGTAGDPACRCAAASCADLCLSLLGGAGLGRPHDPAAGRPGFRRAALPGLPGLRGSAAAHPAAGIPLRAGGAGGHGRHGGGASGHPAAAAHPVYIQPRGLHRPADRRRRGGGHLPGGAPHHDRLPSAGDGASHLPEDLLSVPGTGGRLSCPDRMDRAAPYHGGLPVFLRPAQDRHRLDALHPAGGGRLAAAAPGGGPPPPQSQTGRPAPPGFCRSCAAPPRCCSSSA